MQDIQVISDALGSMPPRFHLGAVPPPDSVRLPTLLEDSAVLTDHLKRDAELVGAADDQVSASMFVQHVAMVLGGSTLAAAVLHGSLPVADAAGVSISPGGPRSRWQFALDAPAIETGEIDGLVARWVTVWVDGVLNDLVDAVHRSVKVGRRLLADNIASAAAANLVFLDWWAPDRELGRLAPMLAELGSPPIGDTVEFSTIPHGGRDGLRSSRRSCCLHDRCDPPHWCPTCPRITEAEAETIMRTHLGHLDAVVAARGT